MSENEDRDLNRPDLEEVDKDPNTPAEDPVLKDQSLLQGEDRLENEAGVQVEPVEVDTFADLSAGLPTDEEETVDFAVATSNMDDKTDQFENLVNDYTNDPDIIEDFVERQNLSETGSAQLWDKLMEYTDTSPNLSAGDVDAEWDYADESGDEAAGGSVGTPGQDSTEELGEALGLVYNDNEPLHTEDKLEKRDKNRWELRSASGDPGEAQDDGQEKEDL